MNSQPEVLVCRRIPQIGIDLLSQVANVKVHQGNMPPTRKELLSSVRGCTGILSLLSDRIDMEVMEAAGPQLRVISNFAVGFNNIDIAEAERRSIAVGNTPDVLTDATADIAVGLLLAAARQFKVASRDTSNGGWRTWEPLGWLGQELSGKTLGIIGMGRIGQAVARRLQGGWKMRVLCNSRTLNAVSASEIAAEFVSLEQLCTESDFISIHLPLTDSTRNMISDAQFRMMKPTVVLINTARGEVIDQVAMVRALDQNPRMAVGLDVCTPEPLPLDHPLHRMPNCILLPHIGSATYEARNLMAERAAANVIAGIQGRPLPFSVSAPSGR